MHSPYTYHICWTKQNLHYYGVRVSPKAAPGDDLWKLYFTSSHYVRSARKDFGEPDIVEIRRTFNSERGARTWETRVLIKMKVRSRDDWLNKSDGRYQGSTSPKSSEHRLKISNSHLGKRCANLHNKDPVKIAKTAEKHRGMKRSAENKKNMSIARKKMIQDNGGNFNTGHRQYYNPNNPAEHIQCLPINCPSGWVAGNWKASTSIIGCVANKKGHLYYIHRVFNSDVGYVTYNGKKHYRRGLGEKMHLTDVMKKLTELGFISHTL